MNIDEKSEILTKLSGHLVTDDNGLTGFLLDGRKYFPVPDLYRPENMYFAWKILNWVATIPHEKNRVRITDKFDIWWSEAELYSYSPDIAISIALDKILELAFTGENDRSAMTILIS